MIVKFDSFNAPSHIIRVVCSQITVNLQTSNFKHDTSAKDQSVLRTLVFLTKFISVRLDTV